MQQAARKAEAAFAFFEKLGVPYYCFHDRDVAPEGATARESHENFRRLIGQLGEHQQRSGVKLLWGTANLFSHRTSAGGGPATDSTNSESGVICWQAWSQAPAN